MSPNSSFGGRRQKPFGVECGDWIEPHGAHRRNVAGGERDRSKYKDAVGEDGQIRRRVSVEQTEKH